MPHFDVKAITASRAYTTYKETVRLEAKHKHFDGWKTVAHFPRKISRDIYFFIKKEGERISGNVKSLNYKPSPIPSEDLEVPLLLTFSCPKEWVRNKMKDFINDFYPYDFTGIIHNDNSSHEIDTEIDLKLTEKEDDKEEIEASALVVDDKVTSKLLRQDTACIAIDDY